VPKTRKRVNQSGGKSIAVRIKHKIGNRKSSKGANFIGLKELGEMLKTVEKRDRNMLRHIIANRNTR